jgi:hypothetical protein
MKINGFMFARDDFTSCAGISISGSWWEMMLKITMENVETESEKAPLKKQH